MSSETDTQTMKDKIFAKEGPEAYVINEKGDYNANKSDVFIGIITDIILYISVCACICGLWHDMSLFAVTLTVAPIAFLRLLRLVNNKAFMFAWLAVLGATVAALIILHSSFLTGGKLLANELFDIGEAQQGYIYDRFEVNEAAGSGSKMICAAILSAFLATGLLAAVKPPARLFTALGLFIFTVLVFAYFGIQPLHIAVIGILTAPVLYFLVSSGISFKGFLIAAAFAGAVITATGFITWAVAPEKNFAVSETEERLRDIFAGRTLHFANMTSEEDDNEEDDDRDDITEDDNMSDEKDAPKETGGSINGITLLFIILAIAAILLILFVPAIFLDKVKKKRDRNREGMDSEDNSVAIRSQFMYLMRWFKYKGWYRENEFFEKSIPDIKKEMSEDYAESFKEMHALWQEAAFSQKKQSSETRRRMENFVKESVDYLWDQADFKERLRIKYKYAL